MDTGLKGKTVLITGASRNARSSIVVAQNVQGGFHVGMF